MLSVKIDVTESLRIINITVEVKIADDMNFMYRHLILISNIFKYSKQYLHMYE